MHVPISCGGIFLVFVLCSFYLPYLVKYVHLVANSQEGNVHCTHVEKLIISALDSLTQNLIHAEGIKKFPLGWGKGICFERGVLRGL